MINATREEENDNEYLNFMFDLEKEKEREYKSYEEFIEIEFPNYNHDNHKSLSIVSDKRGNTLIKK